MMERFCWNCGNYRPFYEKGVCCFAKANYGFCSKKLRVTEKHEACGSYRTRPRAYPVKNALLLRRLEEAVVNISAIKEILEENS